MAISNSKRPIKRLIVIKQNENHFSLDKKLHSVWWINGISGKEFQHFQNHSFSHACGNTFQIFYPFHYPDINSTCIPYSVMWFAFHMPCMRTELKLESPRKFHITVRQ